MPSEEGSAHVYQVNGTAHPSFLAGSSGCGGSGSWELRKGVQGCHVREQPARRGLSVPVAVGELMKGPGAGWSRVGWEDWDSNCGAGCESLCASASGQVGLGPYKVALRSDFPPALQHSLKKTLAILTGFGKLTRAPGRHTAGA